MHPQVIEDHPGTCPVCHMDLTPLGASSAAGDAIIAIDPVVVQNMGVQTTAVREATLARSIRMFGTIEEVESRVHELNLLVSGRIRRLFADTTGVRVEKYAPLFELFSPELHSAIEESIRLRRATPTAPTNETSTTGRRSLYEASLRRLELLGLPSAQAERLSRLERAPRTVTFSSPAAGVVTDKEIVDGAAVIAGERALRIVDYSVVWLEAKVFEPHIGAVANGQRVTATVDALPGETFVGEIVFVAPELDPVARTLLVRVEIDNRGARLRPGMFATSILEIVEPKPTLVVPREAVIDTGARQVAFVALGEGHFEARDVEVGVENGAGEVQILDGLRLDEQVVTRGQFLLDAESRMREAVQKFLSERREAAPRPIATPTEAPHAPRPQATRPKPPKKAAPIAPAAEPPEPATPTDYTCPMHPEVHRDGPDTCPICKMDLVPNAKAR
jgi:RND family efflux transporter MFP subunit